MKKTAICLAILAAASLAFAQAAPPDLVNFQGVLRDSSDAPLDGSFDMTFRFFDTAGNEILVDSHEAAGSGAVTVTGGLFNVALGSGTVTDGSDLSGVYTTLTDMFGDYSAVYVEVQVGAEVLSPRIRVVSAAYALNAENVGGISSGNFLRSDVDDTAAGVITFTAPTTDVQGSLVDTVDSVVNVGDDLFVQGGNIGVGVSPNSTYGGYFKGTVRGSYSSVNENTTSTLYGAVNSAQNSDAEIGELYGTYGTANAKGTNNAKTVYGLSGHAIGDSTSTGDHYGVFGEAALSTTSGSHYGVYGIAGGGATNYGGYFQGGRYGVRSVAIVSAPTGYGSHNSVQSSDTGTGTLYGTYGTANALGTDNEKTLYGLSGHAIGDASSQGDQYGVYGEAILPAAKGIHYGVYGAASGGATNYGGYFAGNEYGARCVASPTASTGYGSHNSAQNGGAGKGILYGTYSTANAFGTDNEKTVHGVSGHAVGDASSQGDHYALHGVANSITSLGKHYGVYGEASGGAKNYGGYFLGSTWGLYTPNDAYVGGMLDFGTGANDDLQDTDVTTLTGGGNADALHSHNINGGDADTLDGLDSLGFLRRNAQDTSTASVAGNLYKFTNSSGIGGAAALRSEMMPTGVAGGDFYGVVGASARSDTASTGGDVENYGVLGETSGTAIGAGSITHNYGLYGKGTGSDSTGDVYNYGVYGEAAFGTTNWGLYTPNDAYVGSSLGIGAAPAANEKLRLLRGSSTFVTDTWAMVQVASDTPALNMWFNVTNDTGAPERNGTLGFAVAGETRAGLTYNRYYDYIGIDHVDIGKGPGASAYPTDFAIKDGLVGIGTRTPSNKLSVSGNADISGNLDIGGVLDLGGGANDDLTATDVTELTDGLDTTLHGHDITGAGDGRYLRKDVADTAAGEITFNQNIRIGDGSGADDDYLYFDAGTENIWWNNASSWFVVSDDLTPAISNSFNLGSAVFYWNLVYADGFRYLTGGDSDWIAFFDTYPDLDLIDGMKGIPVTNQQTGEVQLVVDPATIPAIIRGTPTPDDPMADQFVDVKKADSLAFGGIRELRREGRDREKTLRDELDLRTPDKKTGRQEMDGSLQIILDKDANDASRFSIFRDGADGLQEEVFRVDEEGNVHARGSFRPASLDLAEHHPVSEAVEPGDVLVMDPQNPSVLQRCSFESDPRVVGIVSAAPGVELGRSLQRLAGMEPELAARIDDARARGDKEAEDAAWAQLEEQFKATHAAVALSGTVACKVDAGYGAVEAGDLLVASPTPGHAMKADSPAAGTILGKAMGALDAGTGAIKVLVMLR